MPAEILRYWEEISPSVGCLLQTQRSRWRDFRRAQDRTRQRCRALGSFEEHANAVKKYWVESGLPGEICLSVDRTEQSKLDDWKEYHVWELKKAVRLRLEMRRAAMKSNASQQRLRSAENSGQRAERIQWIQQEGFDAYEARRRTAETALQRQSVLLRWSAEQLSRMATGGAHSNMVAMGSEVSRTRSAATGNGKRKRIEEQVMSHDEDFNATVGVLKDPSHDRISTNESGGLHSLPSRIPNQPRAKRRCLRASQANIIGHHPEHNDTFQAHEKADKRTTHAKQHRIQPSRRAKIRSIVEAKQRVQRSLSSGELEVRPRKFNKIRPTEPSQRHRSGRVSSEPLKEQPNARSVGQSCNPGLRRSARIACKAGT